MPGGYGWSMIMGNRWEALRTQITFGFATGILLAWQGDEWGWDTWMGLVQYGQGKRKPRKQE
jgi:hypothetical protein